MASFSADSPASSGQSTICLWSPRWCSPNSTAGLREVVKSLADGDVIKASLVWRPPLLTIFAFQLGLGIVACGMLGVAFSLLISLPPRVESSPYTSQPAAPASASAMAKETMPSINIVTLPDMPAPSRQPVISPVALEYGEHGEVLEMLASRFRSGVMDGTLDQDILTAVEWAFDRHAIRAIRVFQEILGQDESFGLRTEQILDELASINEEFTLENLAERRLLANRFGRIVEVVNPRFALVNVLAS